MRSRSLPKFFVMAGMFFGAFGLIACTPETTSSARPSMAPNTSLTQTAPATPPPGASTFDGRWLRPEQMRAAMRANNSGTPEIRISQGAQALRMVRYLADGQQDEIQLTGNGSGHFSGNIREQNGTLTWTEVRCVNIASGEQITCNATFRGRVNQVMGFTRAS